MNLVLIVVGGVLALAASGLLSTTVISPLLSRRATRTLEDFMTGYAGADTASAFAAHVRPLERDMRRLGRPMRWGTISLAIGLAALGGACFAAADVISQSARSYLALAAIATVITAILFRQSRRTILRYGAEHGATFGDGRDGEGGGSLWSPVVPES